MESTDSSSGSQQPQLPPGFRFHPTDEELVVHYLKKKAASTPLPVDIIAEVDLYKFDPWELPAKATFGEQEWYFFSPRDRKYPNGARPNRAATSGYWKATGTDRPVFSAGGTQKVGVKKALVFYGGKPPKGVKTNWIMHEYRIAENKTSNKPPGCDVASKKVSLRLDDWVLCRIYKKNNTQRPFDHERDEMNDMMIVSTSPCIPNSIPPFGTERHQELLKATNYGSLLDNEHSYEGMMNNSSSDMMNSGSNISQLSSKSQLPVNLLPAKRPLPAGLYWNIEDNGSSPSTKRFLGDDNVDDGLSMNNNNSVLSQFPQSPSLHQQPPVLGSLTDGVFRQPYNQITGRTLKDYMNHILD